MSGYRRGHYRRSPNGGRHWVRPHTVNRGQRATPRRAVKRFIHVHPMPSEPNATCPVCGARVYYWQSHRGEKVWFDALGAPWPKHPCLDAVPARDPRAQSRSTARQGAEGPLGHSRPVEDPSASTTGAGCGCLIVGMFLIAPASSAVLSILGRAGPPWNGADEAMINALVVVSWLLCGVVVARLLGRRTLSVSAEARIARALPPSPPHART